MGFLWDIKKTPDEIVIEAKLMLVIFSDLGILIGVVLILLTAVGYSNAVFTGVICIVGLFLLIFLTQLEPYYALKNAKEKGYLKKNPLALILNNYQGEENITKKRDISVLVYGFPVPSGGSTTKISIKKNPINK